MATVLGPVQVNRAWYHCGECKRGFAPRDEQLGVAGTSLSPGVAEMIARAGSEVPFGKAAGLLADLAGVGVSARTVERSAEASGAAARAAASTESAALRARTIRPLPPPDPVPDMLYVETDGTGVPMRPGQTVGHDGKSEDGVARTREIKLARFFTVSALDDDGYPLMDQGDRRPARQAVRHALDRQRRRRHHHPALPACQRPVGRALAGQHHPARRASGSYLTDPATQTQPGQPSSKITPTELSAPPRGWHANGLTVISGRMTTVQGITFRSDVTVELIKHAASDADVIWAARVSTKGEQTLAEIDADPERSAGLINFLMRDRHGTPFEHSSMTFYVQAPIFVFREFMRHRTFSYNEESGRYRKPSPVFYRPGPDRKLVQTGKPGTYVFEDGTPEQHELVSAAVEESCRQAYAAYLSMLEAGVAREVARTVLPVGLYSSMYATCNARALMNFLSLRVRNSGSAFPSFPQREIEMVAEQMEALWARLMPLTHAAFERNGRVCP